MYYIFSSTPVETTNLSFGWWRFSLTVTFQTARSNEAHLGVDFGPSTSPRHLSVSPVIYHSSILTIHQKGRVNMNLKLYCSEYIVSLSSLFSQLYLKSAIQGSHYFRFSRYQWQSHTKGVGSLHPAAHKPSKTQQQRGLTQFLSN